MKNIKLSFMLVIALLVSCCQFMPAAFAVDAVADTKTETTAPAQPPVTLPAKEKFYLFLLVGQSNMAGRGKIEPEDKIANPRVLTLNKDNKWEPAVDPIHFDKPGAGVGLGRNFGITLAEKIDKDITIGLIPCAQGGSPISSWQPGAKWEQTKSKPYDDMLVRANAALKDGVLKGILWHQGESDTSKNADKYQENLTALIARFRKDLQTPDVPVLLGQLGPFRKNADSEGSKTVDKALQTVAKEDGNAAFVSAEGLTSNPDFVHFDAKSQREFGKRYEEAYLKLLESKKVKEDVKK